MPNEQNTNAQPDSFPYLPRCVGTQAVRPSRPGAWEHNAGLLDTLAQGLDVRGTVDWSVLTAIPTIWARPLLFAEALLDEHHPLHLQVRREWRGLLGLLCLQDYNGFGLRVQPINVNQYSQAGELVAALKALLPEPREAWETCGLLKVDNVVVGGTSPKTLVFAAAEYTCPRCVPWMDAGTGRLIDPLVALANRADPTDEMAALKTWVGGLKEAVNNAGMPALSDVDQGKLVRRLTEWYDEIPGKTNARLKFVQPGILSAAGMNAPYSAVPGAVMDERQIVGDFFLAPTRHGARAPIIVTEKGWQETDRVVWRGISPAELSYPAEAQGTDLDNGRVKYEWIRPDLYFFTDKVLILPSNDKTTMLHHHDAYVPPLRREVLDYFEVNDLEGLFTWESTASGVKVTLRLPLKSPPNQKRFAEVSRIYSPDQIVDQRPAPFLEVWPNFRADNWNQYYCVAQVTTRTPFGCYPYPSDVSPTVKHKDSNAWRLKQLPESIICTWDGLPVGMIPIRQPDIVGPASASVLWRVAVDFGTSNTTAFVQRSRDGSPTKFEFADRCIQITSVAPQPRRFFTYTNFFPPDVIDGLFPSQLRIIDDRGVPIPEPILDGILQFVEPMQWTTILEDEGAGQVQENLKWSMDPSVRKYIATFLKQLLLMTAAEARASRAGSIELRYSYPSAFSTKMINQLRMFWGSIAEAGKTLDIKMIPMVPETESAAACKYLIHERGAAVYGATRPQVSLDIGGGTTDVAVWCGGALAAQTSLLLGGREIAQFAKEREEFRAKLEEVLGIKVKGALFKEHPHAILNILLRQFGPQLVDFLRQGFSVQPEFKRARTMIFLMLAGGFYYAGMMLRKLAKAGTVDSCDVYLAGNGAKMADWVSFADSTFGALREVLLRGVGSGVKMAQVLVYPAEHPKEEVARGLAYDFGSSEAINKASALLGESGYIFDSKPLDWDYDVYGNLDLIDPSKLRVPNEFPELSAFVEVFNKHADDLDIEPLTRDMVHPTKVGARIATQIAKLKADKESALVQPFFIEAVRCIMTELHQAPLPKV